MNFTDAEFINCHLQGANFTSTMLEGAKFVGGDPEVSIENVKFEVAKLEGATFSLCNLNSSSFNQCELTTASFDRCTLNKSSFVDSQLKSARFDACELKHAAFNEACLTGTQFLGCTVNDETSFIRPLDTRGMTIDRFTLECLGPRRGGLTIGNQMVMTITDDVAKLRSEFGGIWGLIHLVSLAIFAAPYIWFLITHYAMARWDHGEAEQSTMLGIAFMKFIASGGATWKHWQLSFSLLFFVVYLIYNIVRLCLVWKTKTLETKQEVTGYPVDFRLAGSRWEHSYDFVHSMFWIGVGLVCLNSLYFLAVKVPISP